MKRVRRPLQICNAGERLRSGGLCKSSITFENTGTIMSELNLSNKVRMTFLSAALSLAALGVAFTQLAHGKSGKSETKAEPPKVLVDSTPIKRDTKLTTSFAPVIKRVAPSVVNVFISSTPKNVS